MRCGSFEPLAVETAGELTRRFFLARNHYPETSVIFTSSRRMRNPVYPRWHRLPSRSLERVPHIGANQPRALAQSLLMRPRRTLE